MEAGYRAAGHRHEQDREKGSQTLVLESGKGRKIHGRMGKDQSQHRSRDHSHEHKGRHIISGLHHEPHGQHCRQENVNERDVHPHVLAQDHREIHTEHEGQHSAYKPEHDFFPARKFHFMLHHSEHNGKQDEEQRDASRRSVYRRVFSQGLDAVCHYIGVEGVRHHIGEGSDHDQAEQPAESKEELSACFPDVFLDQKSHGLSVIFHTGVQRSKICHCSEEDPSQDDPQKDRQPSERRRLDRSGDRTRARDGGKLMGEYGPSVRGHIILSVIVEHRRCLRFRVNSPFFRQPASVQRVCRDQAHCGDQYDY